VNKEDLILFVIKTANEIHGKTKLVKILQAVDYLHFKNTGEEILDLEPDNFGAFDSEITTITNFLKQQNLIEIHDNDVRFSYYITTEGNKKTTFSHDEQTIALINILNSKPFNEVLSILYEMFPELTKKSQIKATVNKEITEKFSYLSSDYELGSEKFELRLEDYTTKYSSFAKHNDLEQRIFFMKMFGWDKLPAQTNPDPKESDDLLSHYPKLEKIKK